MSGLQKISFAKSIGPGFDRPHRRQPNRSPFAKDYRECIFEIKQIFGKSARAGGVDAGFEAWNRIQRIVGKLVPKRKR
jgi:hypothetical protein